MMLRRDEVAVGVLLAVLARERRGSDRMWRQHLEIAVEGSFEL